MRYTNSSRTTTPLALSVFLVSTFVMPAGAQHEQVESAPPDGIAQPSPDPCAGVDEQVDAVSGTGDAETATMIQLLSVTPEPGTQVAKSDAITAELAYRVESFEVGKYMIMAQAETTTWGVTSSARRDERASVALPHAQGTLHLCIPVAYLWEKPGIQWPLTIKFQVNEGAQLASSRTIAYSEAVAWPSKDGVLVSTQPKTGPGAESYERQLSELHVFFESMQATRDLCIESFPALSGAVTKAYRAWEDRNAALRQEIGELYFNNLLRRMNDSRAHASSMFDMYSKFIADRLRSTPPEQLHLGCEGLAKLLESEATDPQVRYREQLAALRAQAAEEPIEETHPSDR